MEAALTTIISAISTIGFPIVAYLLMFRSLNTKLEDNTKAVNEMNIKLAELAKEIAHAKEDDNT